MNTRILLTFAAAALTVGAINVSASDALLSPRAMGNQIKRVSGIASDPNLINTAGLISIAPRAAGNQIALLAGTNNQVNPAITCANNMPGSPKAIQACVEHPGAMPPSAVTVAPLK
ncbi:MAG: hypothetical protein KGJ60_08315 [Verrucomicrobiota bacterium]|nr:hypothetical protein [Verrucomicrobiota bacterium]